jgi:hypothetical protein
VETRYQVISTVVIHDITEEVAGCVQVVTKVEGLEAYGFNTQLCAREFQKKSVAYVLACVVIMDSAPGYVF